MECVYNVDGFVLESIVKALTILKSEDGGWGILTAMSK